MPEESSRDTRSKNAKAQARHRQKRKAYITSVRPVPPCPFPVSVPSVPILCLTFIAPQLETTIEKLLAAMNLSREQAEALPMPHIPSRERELEAENQRLRAENANLRGQLHNRQVAYMVPGSSAVPIQSSPPISPSNFSEGSSSMHPSPNYSGWRKFTEPDDALDNRVSGLVPCNQVRLKKFLSLRVGLVVSQGPVHQCKTRVHPRRQIFVSSLA